MTAFSAARGRVAATTAFALVLALLLAGLAVLARPERASAAGSNLICDQNTLYGITSAGAMIAIDATTGAATSVANLSPATNALGVTSNGTAAYAFQSGGNAIVRYDPTTGTSTTISNPDPGGSQTAIRGAVDPVNDLFYYAGNGASPRLAAYNTDTGVEVGQIGTITGLTGANGDMAFGSDGTLYLVDGAIVYRIDNVPSTAGTASLAATQIATLPNGTNSPGIAYSTDGYLYLAQSSSAATIYQINPSSGALVNTRTISTGQAVVDLASCNYADSVRGAVNVRSRAAATDQFAVTITGGGITSGNTATTSGTTTGLQPVVAGPNLTVAGATYTVTQTAAGTTNLANYSVGWACVNTTTGTQVAHGTGNTASFAYPSASGSAGSDVACTFTDAAAVSAVDDSATTAANTSVAFAPNPGAGLLANDSGDSLTITSHTQPAHGTVAVAASGAASYTPNTDFSGVDSFDYTVTDVNGNTATATATVHVTPVATGDQLATTAGTPVTSSTLTANDHGSGLTVASATNGTHGTVTVAAGSVTYTPAAGFSGTDTFAYTATDAAGQPETGVVTVTVGIGAVADTGTTAVNTQLVVLDPGVLGNDHGTGLVVTSFTPPAHGTVNVNSDGSYVYTPAAGYSGLDSFQYTESDTAGQAATAIATIAVTPEAQDDTATTSANAPVTLSGLTANDAGTGLTVSAVGSAAHGTTTLNADHSVSYKPANDFSGSDSFQYTATDASGQTTTAQVNVTVTPVAVDDTASTSVDTAVVISSIAANDHGSALAVTSVTAPAHGTAVLNSDGSVTYTPAAGFTGSDVFHSTVMDSAGQQASAAVTVAVTPAAVDDAAATTANTPVTTAVLTANDRGTGLTVQSITQPAHGSAVLHADGTVTYTPTTDFSGDDSLGYVLRDGNGQTAPAVVHLTVTPVATADTMTIPAGATATDGAPTSNDHGTGLVVTAITQPAHGTASLVSGAIGYAPDAGFSGDDTVTETVTDAAGRSTTTTLTITVLPVAEPDTASTPVNTSITVSTLPANDAGTALVVTAITQPAHGTATLSGGAVVYTPAAGYSGPDSLHYTATDAAGRTTGSTLTIQVTPTAANDSASTSAGTPVVLSGILDNDRGSALAVTAVGTPASGTAVIGSDGRVTYTPAANFSGTDTFGYTVTDASGQTTTATVVVTVAPAGLDDSGTTRADTALTVPATTGVLANDHGSGLVVVGASGASHGSVSIEADGGYSYTPAAGYSGPDSFDYVAHDSSGQDYSQTVHLTVTPVAVDDSAATSAGQPVTAAVLVNDLGSGLTITALGEPSHGTVAVGAVGTLDYTPEAGFSGDDTVGYTVTDAAGQTSTAVLHVTVTPVAVGDQTATTVDTARTVAASALLANDLGSSLAVTAVTQPGHGTAVLNGDGSVTYTPASGYSGPDSLHYTVTDAAGRTATATLSIVVGNAAMPDFGTTPANTALVVAAADGVLANDGGTGLTATPATQPAHGTLSLSTNGAYTYTPAHGFSGTDTFEYTATDANGQTATGVVTITVTPTAGDDVMTVAAGSAFTESAPGVLGNDGGSGLHVTASTAPAHGTATLSADGTLAYSPAAGYSGPDSFGYTVTDAAGRTATATVRVSVTPLTVAADPTTTTGTPVSEDAAHGLLAGAVGTGLTVAVATQPAHGTVVVNPDGSYTYTPAAGFAGTDAFTFTVTDASGQTANGTATVLVQPLAVAVDDRVTTTPGTRVVIDPLSDDAPTGGSAFDPSTMRIWDPKVDAYVLVVDEPGVGTWQVVSGAIAFTPAPGYVGTAAIRYQVADGTGRTVTANVSVVVTAVASLAYTGVDQGELTGLLTGGLGTLLLGLALLLAALLRRRRTAEPIRRRATFRP